MERYRIKEITALSDLPLQSGAIGYVGYDIAACYEDIGQLPTDELQVPDMAFWLFETFLVLDHQRETLIILENCYSQRGTTEMEQALQAVQQQLRTPVAAETRGLSNEKLHFTSNVTQHAYETIVREAKARITAGDMFRGSFPTSASSIYTRSFWLLPKTASDESLPTSIILISITDSKWSAVHLKAWFGFKETTITTNPIAGTRKGGTKAEDEALAAELLADEKERAEHQMLIDLGRNDLGRIAEHGTVHVPLYMVIEKYRYVMHIVSVVAAKRRAGVRQWMPWKQPCQQARSAGHQRFVPWLASHQMGSCSKRGLCGSRWVFSRNDQADFAIGIRTMVLKDAIAYVQAGAGVVYDSDPSSEYHETLHKAKALLRCQPMILLVDNYDSFTYNLLQLCPEETVVLRNDDPELFIVAKEADAIIFSRDQAVPKRQDSWFLWSKHTMIASRF